MTTDSNTPPHSRGRRTGLLAGLGSALADGVAGLRERLEGARAERDIERLKAHIAWQPDADRTPRTNPPRDR